MAESILSSISSLLGNTKFTIKDEFGYAYWRDLKIVSVEIMGDAATAENPLATNELSDDATYVNLLDIDISNGKIIRPVKLKLKAICNNLATIEGIMLAFAQTINMYDITSRKISADAMMMKDVEILQTSDMISAVTIVIEWEQAEPPVYNAFDPDNPSNDKTYGLRIQTPPNVPLTLSGIGSNIVSSAESLYNKVSKAIGG